MSAVQLRDDNFEIAKATGFGDNAPFEQKIRKFRLWHEFIRARMGVPYHVDYMVPYASYPENFLPDDDEETRTRKYLANRERQIKDDKDPSCFLPKYLTDVIVADEASKKAVLPTHVLEDVPEDKLVVCRYQNILVTYVEDRSSFRAAGLRGSVYAPQAVHDEKYLNRVLFENIKAAMILAHSAKAAGWESVNFGNTADPAKRLALKVACDYLELKVAGEDIDVSALPQNTHYKETLRGMIEDSLEGHKTSLAETIWPEAANYRYETYVPPPRKNPAGPETDVPQKEQVAAGSTAKKTISHDSKDFDDAFGMALN